MRCHLFAAYINVICSLSYLLYTTKYVFYSIFRLEIVVQSLYYTQV